MTPTKSDPNKLRISLLGSTSAEAVFAFYGLNMIGAGVSIIPTYMSFSLEKITTTIKNEKLTDLILTDDFAQPALINSIISKKRELGLYNVIVLHVPVGGNAVDGLITAGQKYKHFIDRMTIAPICMDALMELYSDGPIDYAPEESSEASIILHTSGTTSGTGKPIPISDAAINSIGKVYEVLEKRYPELENNIVCGVTIDLSNSYSTVNQIHGPFTLGGTIIMVPGCAMNPAFYKSVPEFRQTLLFVTAAFLEIWMKVPDRSKLDFSSLRLLVLGGSFVSAADKHRYLEFLTECGAKDLKIINGYGLTELGGACILSTEDIDDEAIGYPMPGVTMLLYDEDKKKYFTAKDAPCSGILYLRSDLMTGGFLGDKEVVKTEAIDGEKYICTNDIVRLDKTGKCYFLGRANRYFINDSGKKFESGRVEVAISRQPGIESCVVVPMYLKLIHDNIPMLCVKTHDEDRAKETVRKALIKVYKTEGFLPADQMPHRILITEEMPRNGNGKADIFKIMRGEAEGIQYSVKPIKIGSKLMDITLEQLDPESEKEEILQNAYKTIAKDLLESNNPIKNIKMEEITMNQSNPFEFFKEMNNKQTEAFKKMFENNPYCQGYKDYYEKQAETFKKMFENNQYCQNYKEYFEKATKKYKEMAENFKPDTTRAKEYNKILKDHNEKMYKMSVEMVKDMNKENKQFMETFFGMVKEDAEIQKETAKKAAAKQKEAFKKAAEKQKETIKKAAAKAAPAKKAEAPKAAAKPAAKAAPKAAAKKPAAKKAPAKKAAKKTK